MLNENNRSVKSLCTNQFNTSVQDLFNNIQSNDPFGGFGSMTQLDDAVRKFFFKNAQNAQLYQFMIDQELNFENKYGSISTNRESNSETEPISDSKSTKKYRSRKKPKKNHSHELPDSDVITITIELYSLCTITLTIAERYGVQSAPKINVSGYSIATNIADVENRLKRLFLS